MSTETIYRRDRLAAGSPLQKVKEEFSRLTQVLTAPRAAFDSVAHRPKFLLPFLLCTAMVFATSYVVVERIGIGHIVAVSVRGHARAGTIVALVKSRSTLSGLAWNAYAAISTAVAILVVAALLSIMLNARMKAGWRRVFSVVAHAMFGYLLVSGVLTVLFVMLRTDFKGFDFNNPVPTNLALFIDAPAANPLLYHLAASADILSFWLLFLLATGLSAISPHLTFRASLLKVATLWALYVLCKVGVGLLQAG